MIFYEKNKMKKNIKKNNANYLHYNFICINLYANNCTN